MLPSMTAAARMTAFRADVAALPDLLTIAPRFWLERIAARRRANRWDARIAHDLTGSESVHDFQLDDAHADHLKSRYEAIGTTYDARRPSPAGIPAF